MTDFTGKDLLNAGYKPEPWFGQYLDMVSEKRLSRSQALRGAEKAKKLWDDAQPKTIPLQAGVDFHINISPENDAERANAKQVIDNFRELVKTPTVVAGAIMPDACPSEPGAIPVGGVIGAKNAIHPGMHSADICCSMFLTVVDADPDDVLKAMSSVTHFGRGGRQDKRFDLDAGLLERFRGNDFLSNGKIISAAHSHLGTQGDGNHFAYVGLNGQGKTVLVTHHGSRGVGGMLYKLGMKEAKKHTDKVSPETSSKNAWIELNSQIGESYWDALQIVRAWTKENHRVLHDAALEELGLTVDDRFWNEHNFCVAGDQMVQTPSGPIKMKDICQGDEVFSFCPKTGIRTTKIVDHWQSGIKKIYKIKTANRSIRVSGDHPLQVVRSEKGNLSYIWVKAKNIKLKDVLVCAEPILHGKKRMWSNDEARFIGAYIGDGWIRSKPKNKPSGGWHTVGLAIGSKHEPHTQEYKYLLERLFPEPKWRNNGKGAFGLTCTSKKTWEKIQKMGISGSSKTRNIPIEAFIQPLEARLHLLGGYIDADGSVVSSGTSNDGDIKLCCVNKNLMREMRELAISCGMRVTNIRENFIKTNYGETDIYTFCISSETAHKIPLWHQEKRRRLVNKKNRNQGLKISNRMPEMVFAQSVRSIEIEEAEPVYDVTVQDATHSFICEGIVVHNCFREDDIIWHAKGATPVHAGYLPDSNGTQIIPMNMAQPILLVQGKKTATNHGFAPHGAGRNMSRTAHIKSKGDKSFEEIYKEETKGIKALFHSGKIDISELPSAYKDADSVQRDMYKFNLAKVVDKIQPYGCIMAGEQEPEPWLKAKMEKKRKQREQENDNGPSM